MERIVKEAGGICWLQLFPWKEQDETFALIDKARDLGFDALVVTIDWLSSPWEQIALRLLQADRDVRVGKASANNRPRLFLPAPLATK